jgi:hypothetical protein
MQSNDVVVRGVESAFFNCEATETEQRFHQSAIATLKRLGAVFRKTGPYPSSVEPNPEQKLKTNGQLISFIVVSHYLLEPRNLSWIADFQSMYRSTAEPQSFQVSTPPLRRDFPDDYDAALQDIANGHREFLKAVIPQVKPRLALADYVWNYGIKSQHIAAGDLRRLFWVTYFGPHYVEHHGKEFFMNTPAWNVEELDGGILVIVTKKFLDFAENEPTETLKYLKQKFKNIRANRFKIHSSF